MAVVLDYREQLSRQREIPMVPDTDRRLVLLEDGADEDWDEEDWDEDEDELSEASGDGTGDALSTFLEGQTKPQLIDLLKELARRFPDVRSALEAQRKLATGTVEQLVHDVRTLIATASAEPGWRDEWRGEGYTPDYSQVRDRLELLLRQGYADEVVDLGEYLLEAGKEQVEQSQDQGETADEIASCMRVVFRALAQSSLKPAEQMQWMIARQLHDSYDLCAGAEVFWEQPHAPAHWSELAGVLLERLNSLTPRREDFSSAYFRERLANWAITALQHAGREAEVIPLCEREAELNGSYLRLVKLLTAAGSLAEAEQWTIKGIRALAQTQPGTAAQLRTTLRELREQAGDLLQVAAMRAEDFFERPSMATLLPLQAAAERAEVWPVVRAAALHYLETSELPQATARVVGDQQIPAWPLPETGLPRQAQRWPERSPLLNVLIELAAHERRPDQVLRWYDQRRAGGSGWGVVDEELVADAVAEAYPERAIAIWKKLAEAQIAQTQTRAYQCAVGYLRKLGQLLERQGRAEEWRRYIAELRQANARKRRLVEMLGSLRT